MLWEPRWIVQLDRVADDSGLSPLATGEKLLDDLDHLLVNNLLLHL